MPDATHVWQNTPHTGEWRLILDIMVASVGLQLWISAQGFEEISHYTHFVLYPWILGLTGRTPESSGMCASSFSAIYPMAKAMRVTTKMVWKEEDWLEITYLHGRMTWRLSHLRATA